MATQAEIVREKFNERWREYGKGYSEFISKMKDPGYVVSGDVTISQVHRALLTDRFIKANYPGGSRVIEAACGNGFNTCYLALEGYEVTGFDVSESAVEQAEALASGLGLPPGTHVLSDHTYLAALDSKSVDVVVALGLMRYLDDKTRGYIYSEVKRALKPGGAFIVSNDNALFDLFALNDGTQRFISEMIASFSEAGGLFPGRTILEVIEENYPLPKRQYASHSVSKNIRRHAENPLEYAEVAAAYGFRLEKIAYPDSHMLPPLLEKKADAAALERLKAKYCLMRSENDWRAMFMDSEFLAFLRR